VKLEESHEETNERKTGRPVLCEKMFCMKLADKREKPLPYLTSRGGGTYQSTRRFID